MTSCLVEVPDLETLGKIQIALKELSSDGLNRDFVQKRNPSFFFFCRQGDSDGIVRLLTRMINTTMEDPATGSASSALAAFLALTEIKQPEQQFQLTQAVEMGRRSEISIKVTLDGSGSQVQKVLLNGSAVQIMDGSILIPP